eukprot:Hpha_TRINITY_DN14854_c0_g1::TRINITY_DN14854_c0_g1_i3::g.169245::m.169245
MAVVDDDGPQGPVDMLKSLIDPGHRLANSGTEGDAELATMIVQKLSEMEPWPPLAGQGAGGWFEPWFAGLVGRVFGTESSADGWVAFERDGWLSRVKAGNGAGQRLAKALSELFHPTGRLMSYIASESREATVRRLWRQAIQTQRCERPTLQMQFPFNLLPTDLQKELQVNWRTIMATGGMSGMGHTTQDTRMPRNEAEATGARAALSNVPFWYPLNMEKPFILNSDREICGLMVTPLAYLFLRYHMYVYDLASNFETKAFEWPGPDDTLEFRFHLIHKLRTWSLEVWKRGCRFLGISCPPSISIWRKLGCPELCPHLCALFDMWLSYYIPAPGQPFLRNQMRKQGWGMYSTMHTPVIDTGNFELEKARQEGGELFLRSFLAVTVGAAASFATNILDQDQGRLAGLWAQPPGSDVGNLMEFSVTITDGADSTGMNVLEDARIRVLMPLQLCFAAVRASHFLLAAEPHGGDTERVRTLARDCFRVVTGHLSLLFRMGSGAMDKITIETEDVPLLDALSVWAALLSPYRLGVACVPFSTGVRAGHRNLVTVAGQADRAPCLTA